MPRQFWSQRFINRGSALLLLAALTSLMSAVGWLLGGALGFGLALALAVGLSLFAPNVSPTWLMRRRGGRPISRWEAPELSEEVRSLASKASIPSPSLWLVPGPVPNAFTMGEGRHAVIGVTPPLLQMLAPRERVAVLAHEIAHLKNGDLRLMRAGETLLSLTRSMSSFGLFLAVFTLPMALFGAPTVPFSVLALLIAAPIMGQALQLGLSRTREHDADLESVRLTSDPEALAQALRKMEASERSLLRWLPLPMPQIPQWLRSHPPTEERIARLRELAMRSARPQPAAPRGKVVQPKWVHARRMPRRSPVMVVQRPRGWFDVRRFV